MGEKCRLHRKDLRCLDQGIRSTSSLLAALRKAGKAPPGENVAPPSGGPAGQDHRAAWDLAKTPAAARALDHP